MTDFVKIDSGQTLSVFQKPGEDIRFPTNKSQSLFTFGSFRIERSTDSDSLSADSRSLSFGSFKTLETLNVSDKFSPNLSYSVDNRELNFKKTDPLSYAYFSSFYTSVAQSINDINENYPYAILSSNKNGGYSIVDYSVEKVRNTFQSTFKIPYTAVTNQGEVIVNSGYSESSTLVNNTDEFAIQLSGSDVIHEIIEYTFIPSTVSAGTSFMSFKVNGSLFSTTTATTFTNGIYVRPTKKRLNIYLKELTRLQKQILLEGEFLIPSAEEPDVDVLKTFTWPKSIDGFNPDNRGSNFQNYLDDILYAAELVDDDKTGIMLRTMVPENFLEQDSEDGDYRSLVETYAKQFDDIKQFIDSIAFAHTINYDLEESVPNKFLFKLSNLLGWQLSSSFNETDLFEYLVGDVESNNTLAAVNVEIWKRILVNIIWLFKKKGTRDALQFIFKLIGAPDCMINLNEFVYDIKKVLVDDNEIFNSSFAPEEGDNDNIQVSDSIINGGPRKINENGYINYNASQFIFQEGGPGRGDGQRYINQWRPEFDPKKRVDNIKVQVGDPDYFGTEHIVNTKEVNISISPADAIECDVLEWLQSTGVCWVWGTTGATFAFSNLTVPFEYLPASCEPIDLSVISGMTFSEFAEHIYANTIDPRTRKTVDPSHTSFWYQELKKIYLLYYYSNSPRSNRLTFKSLEFFVDLLEVQFSEYFEQLIPATTIFQGTGTEYRNTLFNRQKFVYKEGINKGSEFQSEFVPPLNPQLNPVLPTSSPIGDKRSEVKIIEVRGSLTTRVGMNLQPLQVISNIPQVINSELNPIKITSVVNEGDDSSLLGSLEPFDYLVVTYEWTDEGGRDLDSRTAIVGSSDPDINDDDIGWGIGTDTSLGGITDKTLRYVGPSFSEPYLLWGSDNTKIGKEHVLVDFKKLSEDLPDATFEVRLRAFWHTQLGKRKSGDLTLRLKTWKGGEMSFDGAYGFKNEGGKVIDEFTRVRNATTEGTSPFIPGDDVGKVIYTVASKKAELLEP